MKRAKPKAIAVDTETTGLNPWRGDRAWAVSAATADGREWYWEWPVDPVTRKVSPKPADVREINLLLSDELQPKAFWNASFDVRMLDRTGISVRGPVEEVQWMVRACQNDLPAYKLKPIAKQYADIDDDDERALHALTVKARRIGKKLGWSLAEDVEPDYWMVPACLRIPEASQLLGEENLEAARRAAPDYAIGDARRTAILREVFMLGMRELKVLPTWQMEMDLWRVTYAIEERGVLIDEKRMAELRVRCQRAVDEALAAVRAASGRDDFNMNSPKQMIELLFGGKPLRLPVIKRTPKSFVPSTDGDALLPHVSVPLVKHVLAYRGCEKAISSFFDTYERLGERTADGRLVLHPSYNQWGTLTGRYTCSKPNLQQVSDPSTTESTTPEFVVNIREAFVPRSGYRWYLPDYSQVEVIIFADISGEPTMLEAFRQGKDIHTMTANRVWGGEGNPRAVMAARRILGEGATENDAVDALARHNWEIVSLETELGVKTWRKRGKAVTFTKIFGGGVRALMGWVNITRQEALKVLGDYDASFPELKARMQEIAAKGLENGYVLNAYGRRLAVDRHTAYKAVNATVQSSAADLLKRGMLAATRFLDEAGLDVKIAMTIHDEVVFEWAKVHAFKSAVREVARRLSDHGGVFSVPTPVGIGRVDVRWSEQEKVKL